MSCCKTGENPRYIDLQNTLEQLNVANKNVSTTITQIGNFTNTVQRISFDVNSSFKMQGLNVTDSFEHYFTDLNEVKNDLSSASRVITDKIRMVEIMLSNTPKVICVKECVQPIIQQDVIS